MDVVTESLRDKEDLVRINAAACMGELMFYIAAQEPSVEKVRNTLLHLAK